MDSGKASDSARSTAAPASFIRKLRRVSHHRSNILSPALHAHRLATTLCRTSSLSEAMSVGADDLSVKGWANQTIKVKPPS